MFMDAFLAITQSKVPYLEKAAFPSDDDTSRTYCHEKISYIPLHTKILRTFRFSRVKVYDFD